ncbi:twin-arginine translocation signal domain-containing protein [Amycolatopsis methanolica]|uniref:twin-arginine translocation signal domain-containing protein n=1 Tax=Amycolatopsis methanolica TaxID=1814 RepID=UPI0034185819
MAVSTNHPIIHAGNDQISLTSRRSALKFLGAGGGAVGRLGPAGSLPRRPRQPGIGRRRRVPGNPGPALRLRQPRHDQLALRADQDRDGRRGPAGRHPWPSCSSSCTPSTGSSSDRGEPSCESSFRSRAPQSFPRR